MKKHLLIIICLVCYQIGFSQSANWSAVLPTKFPTNASGQIHGISRVSQIKFHPSNANKMYAVSARGGLFISTDAGANWLVAPGTDFMASARLASVCIDYTNDQIIYLGTGDHNYYYNGNGVMKSTNGGQTFTQTTLTGKLVVDMVMDPSNNNSIVAITNAGIYKTNDAGATWTLKTASRGFDDLKQKTPTSRTLFAATRDSAFFRSLDFGDTWIQITSGIVLPSGITNGNGCRIAITPADTNVVYLAMVANSGTVYKSINGGLSFSAVKNTASPYLTYYDNLSTSSGQGDYNFGIGVDRTNANILYLVAHNNWKSTDGGVTWTQLTNWWQKCHTDMHQIITSPFNNTNLYNVNDGGVFLSVDGGNNWTPKSDGIAGYEIYHGSCSPTKRDMFSIGTQDNGELYANSSGWFTNRGGDWQAHCVFDYRPNSSMTYYYNPDWGTVNIPKRRLVNGSDATYGLPSTVLDITDIIFHRSNPDIAFASDSIIFRTTNLTAGTPSWTQIANLGKKIMAMHCHYADANRLYVITSDGMIYVSTNALAATPSFTSYALPNTSNNAAYITSVKSNINTLYITINTKVFRSTNNGATWTNITYNLPSVNHDKILADEYYSSNELVFIASNNTVYYKTATAATWTIFNTNLPSRTDAIDISIFNDSTSNTLLRYTSYGRGMWETPINNLRALTCNFTADNTNPCPGATVTFSDLSTGNVASRNWTFTGGTPSSSTLSNPTVTFPSGVYNVSLTVSDGTSNSIANKSNYISTSGGNLPISEGFEGTTDPPIGWKNTDNGTQGNAWVKTSTAGGFGTSTNSMMFDNYSWNIVGQKDEVQTSRFDLSNYNSARVTFDVAYQAYTGYADTLAVLLSTDCGATFTRLYAKGGASLSSAGSASASFIPTASQWRKDTINLTPYVGQSSVIIAFQNINGYGNKLYLDNINVTANVAVNAGIDKSICLGSSTSIGSASVTGLSYNWSPTTGLSASNISNPNASPSATTTYILSATHNLSGVQNRDTVLVTVNPILNAPTGLTNGSASVNSFTSNWSSVIGATSYAIDVSIDSNFGSFVSGYNALSVTTNSKVVTGLTAGTVYYCRVKAIGTCNSGNSNFSKLITISNPPTALFANTITTNSFKANWTSAIGASSYTIDVSTNRSFTSFLTGYNALSVTSNNVIVSLLNPNTKYYYRLKSINYSGASVYSTIDSVTTSNVVNLNITAFIQGLYDGNNLMTSAPRNADGTSPSIISDTVMVDLRSALSPYTIQYSFKAILNTNGLSNIILPGSSIGNSYYISIIHRNAIETWSANPVLISAVTNYNFSSGIGQAYSSNLADMGNGVFAIFSGDINQDGAIDFNDYPALDISSSNGDLGYLATDLNGDASTDFNDYPLIDINSSLGIIKLTP